MRELKVEFPFIAIVENLKTLNVRELKVENPECERVEFIAL